MSGRWATSCLSCTSISSPASRPIRRGRGRSGVMARKSLTARTKQNAASQRLTPHLRFLNQVDGKWAERTEGRSSMLAEAVAPATRSDILSALKQASAATGSDFDYLLCTAMRESSLHPDAHSRTSTACGLFQFVEQTWFGLVKEFGAQYGL